jgi:hypothetical protein
VTRYYLPALAAALIAGIPAAAEEPAKAPEPMPPATQAPETGTPAPAPADRDREIQELKRLIEQLQKRVEELEKRPTPAPPPPPVPETPAPPADTGGPRATLLPNISVTGNLIARGGDTRAVPGRGRSHFEELEIALQDAFAPKLRYDLYLSAEKEEDWRLGMEEGFVTATGLMQGLNARAGRIRTPFGKFNPLHPHQWPFVTQPSAHRYLLGDHGLISDGAVAEYLLPVKGLYANLQFGLWQTTSAHGQEEEDHAGKASAQGTSLVGHREALGFNGGEHGAYSARLALGKEVGRDRELELGFSRYWGRGEVEGFGRRMLALNGVDLTYRRFPGAYRRLLLQAELLAHETSDIRGETKLRPGMYFLAANRFNRYWEAGGRLDYTRLPFPFDGKEYGASLFLTRYLTEQTSLRLEYRWARDPEFGPGSGIFFQLLFGSGPHTHPLQ